MAKQFYKFWTEKAGTQEQLDDLELTGIPLLREARWYNPIGSGDIDVAFTNNVVGGLHRNPIYVIDIESPQSDIRLDRPVEAAAAIQLYCDILDEAKLRTPNAFITTYGHPIRDVHAAIAGEGSPEYEAWTELNALCQPIWDRLDFFSPSLYVWHPSIIQPGYDNDTIKGWPKFLDLMGKQCRKAHITKPITPFIWSRYRGGGTPYLPKGTMRMIYKHLYKHPEVSGFMLWQPLSEPFDPSLDWAVELKAFNMKIAKEEERLSNTHKLNLRKSNLSRQLRTQQESFSQDLVQQVEKRLDAMERRIV